MTDVQTVPAAVQPSVFDALPLVSPAAASNLLTRPAGTALHVERDAAYITVSRSLIGTCTRDEWDSPAHRRLAIARAWERAIAAIRSEDEEFVSFAPVTLYRDWLTNEVQLADITLPGKPQKLITPQGQRVVGVPTDLVLAYRRDRTSYARWAEGPLPHVDLEMTDAVTPETDRDVQYLRHQNSALRELIDGALSPSEYAPLANDHRTNDGLVDYRLRGIFRRLDLRRFDSKQGTGVSGILLDGKLVGADAFDVYDKPSSATALDAILEAD